MKDARKLSLAAIPAVLALPGLAAAQMTVEKPWLIKIGGSRWSSSEVRDFTNPTAITLGLGYQMPSHGFMSRENGRSFIEADWLHSDDDGNRLDSFGVWYVERVPFSMPTTAQQGMFYGGLGVGLAFNSARAEGTGGTGGSSGGGGSSTNALSLTGGVNDESFRSTRLGILGLIGYEFQQNFFIEAQFRWTGEIEGTRTDSFGLMLGFRF
jgi:hypothetical protein